MNLFAFFRRKTSAEQARNQEVRAELKPLLSLYPLRDVFIPEAKGHYPRVVSLVANGLGAYLVSAHVTAEVVSRLEQRIAELGFLARVQSGAFQTYRRGQEAVSLQTESIGEGTTLLLVSNSADLLQALPDLSPPAPWQVFPNIDASGLGSLQGSLDYWWQHYWWPYWQSLTQEQRSDWLHNPAHPEAWREYVQLQDAFAGNDLESSV